MRDKKISRNLYLKLMVIGIIILRAILLAVIPLLDKTEARYGEIARLMSETNQWVMMQYDYGLPFWGETTLVELAFRT